MMTRKCWKHVTKQDVSFDNVLANDAIKTTKRCGTVGVSEIIRILVSSQTEILNCYYLSWLARWYDCTTLLHLIQVDEAQL